MLSIYKCQGKTDIDLVNLTLANQEYFLCLMDKYKEPLLRYIRRISSFNPDTTEDILQDVFIKIYQNLNDFDPSLKFSSWAYRITHNQVISHYRKTKARPQTVTIDDDKNLLNKLVSNLNIEKDVNNILNQRLIWKILNSLDIKYREVLILKFLEDKSYQEISDIIKKPLGTIATLISRAKEKFHQELIKQDIKI